MQTIIEPFAAHRELGFGVPTLRAWQHSKTMNIEWNDYGMCDAWVFKMAVDSVSMNAAPLEIWKRCKPLRRASFSHGNTGGYISRVPIELGLEMMAVIREHFNAALTRLTNNREFYWNGGAEPQWPSEEDLLFYRRKRLERQRENIRKLRGVEK